MAELDREALKSGVKTIGVWMYWIVGTVILFSISYILYTRFNKQVAAILVFLTSMMALYYYYVKWIVIGDEFLPTIGTCPDFMTNLGVHNNTQIVCSDTMNAYGEGGASAPANKAAALSVLGNNATNDKGYVTNTVVLTPAIPANGGMDAVVIKEFCGDLQTNGISWINLCELS